MKSTREEKKVSRFFGLITKVDENIKEQLKSSPIGKKLNLESKLSLRERQQKQKEIKKQEEEEFTRMTGIQNPRVPWEEQVERTKFELLRLKKKSEKMNQKDAEDADYDDASLSESDFNSEE